MSSVSQTYLRFLSHKSHNGYVKLGVELQNNSNKVQSTEGDNFFKIPEF